MNTQYIKIHVRN